MKKKTYGVSVPFTGKMYIEVEAASEEEAINAAVDEATLDHLEEWAAHHHIITGNVFYGVLNEAEAECLDEETEEET